MNEFPIQILQRLRSSGVAAGFSVAKAEHAVPLARALLAGGIHAIELTLRTPAAMDALRSICKEVPDILVGVGTILTPELVREVKSAGADFGLAPGTNPRVVEAAAEARLPFVPGVATPSDLERAIDLGCRFVKFFPAEASGGIAFLRSFSAPYKHLDIKYFPLGGINAQNMIAYLKEPNVAAVGGSWIVKCELVKNEDWASITAQAEDVARALRKNSDDE